MNVIISQARCGELTLVPLERDSRRQMMKQKLVKAIPVHSILFLFFIFCFCYPQPAGAHSPKNVELEYNAAAQTLKVTITHNTPFPNTHYIKSVVIKNNGQILSTNEYDSQPDKNTFTYSYTVAAKDGDTLEATANCSFFGNKTGTLIIKAK
jgi:hypothetical protein